MGLGNDIARDTAVAGGDRRRYDRGAASGGWRQDWMGGFSRMRRTALIAAIVLAVLSTATTSAAAAVLTHTGSHVYSRTIPKPCFAHAPAGHPRRLALGCVCPAGEVVAHRP